MNRDALDNLRITKREAEKRLAAAVVELNAAQVAARVANLRYQRQALWAKAEDLRRELAETEAKAANIKLDD